MSASPRGLTPDELAAFQRDGYLILPSALTPEAVSSLLGETRRLLDEFSLEGHPLTRFTTADEGEHVGDDYFLSSGDKVRFFFEEDAFDRSTGKLVKPKEKAINKIGHCLHVLSEPFAALLKHDDNSDDEPSDGGPERGGKRKYAPAAIARGLGFGDPRCLQSMVICKQAEIGGAVLPHQDSTFLYTDPPSAVGFWYALEDATVENGCLSFLPGSHKWAPVSKRLVRKPGGVGTEFVDNEGPRFPTGAEYREMAGKSDDDEAAYVAAEVKAGTLVLIHGNLLHKSARNLSRRGRIIYTFHVIEWEGAKYDERNWLQPPDVGFTTLSQKTSEERGIKPGGGGEDGEESLQGDVLKST